MDLLSFFSFFSNAIPSILIYENKSIAVSVIYSFFFILVLIIWLIAMI